jgi:hypothetical protein
MSVIASDVVLIIENPQAKQLGDVFLLAKVVFSISLSSCSHVISVEQLDKGKALIITIPGTKPLISNEWLCSK